MVEQVVGGQWRVVSAKSGCTAYRELFPTSPNAPNLRIFL